jgi:hypothetical protein
MPERDPGRADAQLGITPERQSAQAAPGRAQIVRDSSHDIGEMAAPPIVGEVLKILSFSETRSKMTVCSRGNNERKHHQ